MQEKQIIDWLLQGDVSIQYQVYRDLLGDNRVDLQERIAKEGWGQLFLSKRKPDGHWGDRFYQPKWISSHYTMLDLRNLCLSPENEVVKETIDLTLQTCLADDGGIRLGPSTSAQSDVCVNGMFLNYASYFKIEESKLYSIIDCILKEVMPDGGFNCRTTRSGARHSSLHTTISVLEGFYEFERTGSTYRRNDIQKVTASAEEFILIHRLFLSDHTGEIISKDFLKLAYPCRWKYNILRALDYFQYAGRNWDNRMEQAIQILVKKRNKQLTWNQQSQYPGQVHFEMEKAGKPGRWNTLRAMRVLNKYKVE